MTAVAAVVAGLCAVGPAQATGTPSPYAFAEGAETVVGAASNVEGHRLSPGKTYKSSLPRVGQRFYRLELTADENAYVSVTAVPDPGTKVSYADGVEVSVQDAEGNNCSPMEAEEARFGSSESPRPITATAVRRAGPGEKSCARAGTYYVLVERTRASRTAQRLAQRLAQDDWDLEIHVASEPVLRADGATSPPQTWNSAAPVPPSGERRAREGGTSFSTARGLDKGVWGSGIEPGQTLFYRVPLDWGQQVSVAAELGSTSGTGSATGSAGRGPGRGAGYVSSALVMTLANPVRAEVDDADTAYDGRQKSAALKPLPPVAYENRFALTDEMSAMRFAGWYYLSVHLSPEVAEKFGDAPLELTLRVDVAGSPGPGPSYAGSPVPAEDFGVTQRDTEAAKRGETAAGSGGAAEDNGLMVVVAAGGIGAGAVLLGILGAWTLIARRRQAAAVAAAAAEAAAAAAASGVGPASASAPARFGPPRGW
ncbi:hypothetical protein [Streptomyces sp. NPDC058308]|uniref:hypothetical protein n=1 Tax=Streptomyces sp. NPDC058308 TaxID=3346440 RepID=UPI0036E28E92